MTIEFTLSTAWSIPGHNILRILYLILFGDLRPYNFENNAAIEQSYDFIVVGSGAGGSVIAARLAETSASVLLLEEGPSATPESIFPYLFPFIGQSEIIKRTRLERQKYSQFSLANNSGVYMEGVVMGGGTSINGMQFVKGSREDFDNWASLGNTGWDYDSFLPYYRKSENYVGEVFPGSENLHGRGGPITFRTRQYNTEFMDIFGQGAREIGYREIDPSDPIKIGFAQVTTNVDNGLRVSTSEAYLRPIVSRKNLLIKPRTFVRKILFDINKRAIGVECYSRGKRMRIRAAKEVILSAGAINSPKILMLSGVGPADHLQDLGINVVSNVPGVGQNFHEHNVVSRFQYKYENYNEAAVNTLKIILGQSTLKRRTPKGPLNEFGPEAQGFFNVYDRKNRNWPDIAINAFVFPFVNYISMRVYLTRPKSRGYIRLRSKNYNDAPLVDPRYLQEQDDAKTLALGMKFVHRFMSTNAIQKRLRPKFSSLIPEGCLSTKRFSDSFWVCLVRYWMDSNYHLTGSCKMAPDYDPMGVVSPRLKLRGVKGVRVVDASIMPQIVTVNPMSTIIGIAEKAADMIKEDWGYPIYS